MDQNFRFSINGFNRSDVVRYLEYMNSKHTAKVNQLSMDNEILRQELAALKSDAAKEACEELQAQLESVTAERDALAQRVQALEQELAGRDVKSAAPSVGPQQELEAYRRAEGMEREAREHARRVRLHMQQVISDVCAKVDAAAADCDSVASQASLKLGNLIDSVSDGRRLLQAAADELRNMDLE